jgi:gliding motility-associated-like protein
MLSSEPYPASYILMRPPVKKRLIFFSLLLCTVSLSTSIVFSQSAPCSPFIRTRDTIVCSGTNLTLDLLAPPPPDPVLPGVWRQLIKPGAIDSLLFNVKPFGFDQANQYLYSIIHQKVTRFDLKNNLVSSIPATNWPGDISDFVFDPANNRLLCWKAGRDEVFALPAAGGAWVSVGPGSLDRQSIGAATYWNPLNNQPGIYGGYGFNQVKSWIYENDGTGWQQKRNNPTVDTVPKGGNIIGRSADGSKLYIFSGQGSYSGDELTGSCSLGSPWATAGGMYCWLRDIWELNLSNYTFKNILPVNNQSIQYEGAVAYDYDSARFFLFGGFQPTADAVQNQSLPNTNKTFRFRTGKDAGFTEFSGQGDAPAAAASGNNGQAYYDKAGNRMIWARYDGIWAYYPDSSLIPVSQRTYTWSTGENTASINIKPTQTTQYKITRIASGRSCRDSIIVTIPNMQTKLQHNADICADSTVLDAGAGFERYQWSTGETTQTIPAKQNNTYTVTITIGGCTVSDSSKLRLASPILNYVIRNQKDSVCAGESDTLQVVTPQAGTTYTWYVPGNSIPIGTGSVYVAQNITRNSDFVVNATSNPAVCVAKGAITKIILRTKLPKPVVHPTAIGIPDAVFSWDAVTNAVRYMVSTNKGASYETIDQGPAAGLTKTVSGLGPNQLVSLAVIAVGNYTCETSDSSLIVATTPNPFGNGIYVPNAFTPNGDGVNDVFEIYATAIQSAKLMIYNQWGTQVFMSTDTRQGWDGTYKGTNAIAGVYTYAVDATMQDGKRVTKTGTFTLVR